MRVSISKIENAKNMILPEETVINTNIKLRLQRPPWGHKLRWTVYPMSGITNTSDIAATCVPVDGISDVSVYNGHFPVYPMFPCITDTLSPCVCVSLHACECVRVRAGVRAYLLVFTC